MEQVPMASESVEESNIIVIENLETSMLSVQNQQQKVPHKLEFCKGLGKLQSSNSEIKDLKWNILKEDVSLPAAVIELSKLNHNLDWMQKFVDHYGVKLAPHGKTTMCPELFQRQMQAGAWGISLATPVQVKVAHDFGISKVLLVNQLVGKRNMEIISELLTSKAVPNFEFACLVDSVETINQLGKFFQDRQQVIRVLLEIGVPGGRTGLRNAEQEAEILGTLKTWKRSVHLIGIEIYEGILESEKSIREVLRRASDRLKVIQSQGHFVENPILITGAGSIWFDVVAEELTKEFSVAANWPPALETPDLGTKPPSVEIILRPGCYITNDAENYKAAQNRILANNSVAKEFGTTLQSAFRLWAYVQSIPEPEIAIITLGKRDTGTDIGFPIPAKHFRPNSNSSEFDPKKPLPLSVEVPGHWTVKKMMDQHLFLKIKNGDNIRVGDILAFDISHPCTNFDKWRSVLVTDENYTVIDVLETYF